MVENNEIRTTPTLAGRIVEGVKEGVVGIAIGAVAGAVTGGVLAGMEFDTEQASIAAESLKPAQAKDFKAITDETIKAAINAEGNGEAAKIIQNGALKAQEFMKDAIAQNVNEAFQDDVLQGAQKYVATGAIAGGTFKGLEGVLSNQNDKRQDMDHQRQEQEIQGVGQLASMALAASASANQGLEVLGTHTARLMKERGQQNLVQPASHVERVQQQRIDATPSLGA